jgi:hypothetical protein
MTKLTLTRTSVLWLSQCNAFASPLRQIWQKLPVPAFDGFDLGTADDSMVVAIQLFIQIERRHGTAAATRIFEAIAKPSKTTKKAVEDMDMADFSQAVGKPRKAARHLARPRADGTKVDALRKRIEDAIKRHRRRK